MNTNFLPRKDADFLTWVVSFLTNLLPMLARINFPNDVYQRIKTLSDTFAAKLAIAENPATRTRATVQDKKTARDTLEKEVRQDVQEYLARNHLVSDSDRDNLGLPIRKTTHTPAPVATTHPVAKFDTRELRRILLKFIDEAAASKGKPDGQHGVEVIWGVFDLPQEVHLKDLTRSTFAVHSPALFEFEDEQRGKTVYFALRWENTRGQKGPWSDIVSAVIP